MTRYVAVYRGEETLPPAADVGCFHALPGVTVIPAGLTEHTRHPKLILLEADRDIRDEVRAVGEWICDIQHTYHILDC